MNPKPKPGAPVTARADLAERTTGRAERAEEEVRVPLVEERLVAATRPIDLGAVTITTSVDTVEEQLLVPVTRDDVEIHRVAVNRPLEGHAEPRHEGEWLIIPVVQEVLVVEKRLMVIEEVRVRRVQRTEEHAVRDTVRRSRVTVDRTGLAGTEPATRSDATDPAAADPAAP